MLCNPLIPFALSAPCLRETHSLQSCAGRRHAKHICAVERKKVQVATSYVRGVGEFYNRGVSCRVFLTLYPQSVGPVSTQGSRKHGERNIYLISNNLMSKTKVLFAGILG